ncbi:MAG: D-alanyl-D-alanine carboxypeptidase [Imperialibacter sp.]|uniref:D-alanyl-D-alanine carboxypeptidase n=1 Tax=Imperialibacter sp. TaxID=2038411 RepID=UPI0032EB24B3
MKRKSTESPIYKSKPLDYLWFTLIAMLVISQFSCSPQLVISKKMVLKQMVKKSPDFADHFTGFVLYDPETKTYLADQNGDKYFTPASNTKLFTYYSGIRLLGDSIPALKYAEANDTLFFTGTGDPTFLHPDFEYQPAFDLLSDTSKALIWQPENYKDPVFGPGWSWDDYLYYYQPERAGLPIYGNFVRFSMLPGDTTPKVNPPFFQQFVEARPFEKQRTLVERDLSYNSYLFFTPEKLDTVERDVPFKYSFSLGRELLQDTLKKPVIFGYKPDSLQWKTLKGYPSQKVYQAMLWPSDNFIAEQILVMCSSGFGDTLSGNNALWFVKNKYLSNLPDAPIWHDGSGLSRYNMFTPRSLVGLLEETSTLVEQKELFRTLAIGGQAGTIRRWYAGDAEPYVFAKTGTLSGVHSLSGFIKTNSGKVLIFSFMHNNYPGFTNPIREQMQEVLEFIRDKY